MTIEDDLAKLAEQERLLQFPSFDSGDAWLLGTRIRKMAVERGHAVVIDIRRFGQPLFYTALEGTTPDNADWVRRKTNTVSRFLRSSYAIGLALQLAESTITDKYALPASDYVTHGGSFPIAVVGAGVIGAVTVSGLQQRADHDLVIEALSEALGLSYAELRLS